MSALGRPKRESRSAQHEGAPVRLDQAWIAAHIPHQGRMCLLDAVAHWDDRHIHCTAGSHRAADHPLRTPCGLAITAGIEYAAQAMAVHGALTLPAAAGARQGYLASVRDVHWRRPTLHDVPAALQVHAEQLSVNGLTVLYRFHLEAEGRELLGGRATVVLNAGPLTLEPPPPPTALQP